MGLCDAIGWAMFYGGAAVWVYAAAVGTKALRADAREVAVGGMVVLMWVDYLARTGG